MTRWIRVKANMSLRAYEIFQAESAIPDPVWPDLSFEEIYRIAFKDRPDHQRSIIRSSSGCAADAGAAAIRACRGRRFRV